MPHSNAFIHDDGMLSGLPFKADDAPVSNKLYSCKDVRFHTVLKEYYVIFSNLDIFLLG